MTLPDLISAVIEARARFVWVPLAGTGLEVTADAVRIQGVRVPVSARTAQRVADLLTASDPGGYRVSLPTPELVDLIYDRAELRPPVVVLDPGEFDATAWSTAVAYSYRLDAWLLAQGWMPNLLAAPVGPDWVLTETLTPTRACRYGWHDPFGPTQLAWHAGLDEHDYASGLRLVRVPPGCRVPGLGRVTRQPGVGAIASCSPART